MIEWEKEQAPDEPEYSFTGVSEKICCYVYQLKGKNGKNLKGDDGKSWFLDIFSENKLLRSNLLFHSPEEAKSAADFYEQHGRLEEEKDPFHRLKIRIPMNSVEVIRRSFKLIKSLEQAFKENAIEADADIGYGAIEVSVRVHIATDNRTLEGIWAKAEEILRLQGVQDFVIEKFNIYY